MNMCCYFLCFAFYSFVGWAYESAFYTIQQRKFVNSGFFNGCWCPIYGVGAFLDLIVLGEMTNPLQLFFAGMLLTCTLEFLVSWVLEAAFGRRWWDYTGWPLNIGGRICIIGGIAFGVMSVLLVKYIAPFTMNLVLSLTDRAACGLAAVVAAAMLIDLIITIKYMDKSDEKLWYVQEQEKAFENFKGELVQRIRKGIRR
ncbi:MAG: putative ABC transporter permease [Clostridia bacterium]|nr:putative ABC transporter permease [Clostridia bacterium]